MDLAKLKVFYVVAKAGSFTEASAILNISQSSLSRSVSLFEHRLKTKLFHRSTKGLQLTAEGTKLFEFAQRVMNEAELICKNINKNDKTVAQELKISIAPHMGSSWLMSYLPEFLETHPKLNITIFGGAQRIDMKENDIYIGPCITPSSNLVQRYLKSFPIGFWASPKYLSKHGIPDGLEDLSKHRILAYGDHIIKQYNDCRWILEIGTARPYVRKPYLSVNSLEELMNATQEGGGIAALSKEWPSVRHSDLINILPTIKGPIIDLYFIYKRNMKNAKLILELAEFIEYQLQKSLTKRKASRG